MTTENVPFGLIEMQKFAEQSDDERINVMWSKICDYRRKIAIWNEAMNKMRDRLDGKGNPVCPICKEEMKKNNYEGYYEAFSYWSCGCEHFDDVDVWFGQNAG